MSSTIVSCVVAARLSIVCSPKNSLTNILFYPLLCTHGHGHTRTIIIMIRPNTMEDVEVINFQQPPPQDEESTMDVDVDGGSVEAAAQAAIAQHAAAWADYVGGNDKAKGRIFGAVMKSLKGQGNPQIVNAVLERLRSA